MDLWLGHDFHFICRVFLRPISDNLTRHARLRRSRGERRERDCQYLPEKKFNKTKNFESSFFYISFRRSTPSKLWSELKVVSRLSDMQTCGEGYRRRVTIVYVRMSSWWASHREPEEQTKQRYWTWYWSLLLRQAWVDTPEHYIVNIKIFGGSFPSNICTLVSEKVDSTA